MKKVSHYLSSLYIPRIIPLKKIICHQNDLPAGWLEIEKTPKQIFSKSYKLIFY